MRSGHQQKTKAHFALTKDLRSKRQRNIISIAVNLPLSTSMNRSVFHFLTDAAQRFLLLETTLLFLSQAQSRGSNHQSRL